MLRVDTDLENHVMKRIVGLCVGIVLAASSAYAVAVENAIAAANPLAAEAGMAVLRDGGSAADAAVVIQAMLNLVEPQSSGIGGGAFIVYWDASARSLLTIDGRETAPASATPARFLDDQGQKYGFWKSAVGGQAVGVPGTVKSLDLLHRMHGRKAWSSLFTPAIGLAENGFKVSPRLAKSISSAKHLDRFNVTREYFFNAAGEAIKEGSILRNPAFASTLRQIAEQGADAFYRGPLAASIVQAVMQSSWHSNNITLADMAAYRAKVRLPVCQPYRDYEVCGMGPPTSGGLTVGQILGMLENFDLKSMGWGPELAHHIAEVEKLAYADRALYMADGDFVQIPSVGLLDTDYLSNRARLIDPLKAGNKAIAGTPPGAENFALAPSVAPSLVGTSHFVVRDALGNVLSMTTTIESGFGSRVMTNGFLLNNELTDFDRQPMRDGKLVANRVEGGKRPRSSMSPTIVMRRGHPYLAIGSPGGSRIIGYVAKTIVGILDFDMSPQEAINRGHFVHRNGKSLELEGDTDAAAFADVLQAKGHKLKTRKLTSGLHALLFGPDAISGGADPRREGVLLLD